MEMIELPTSCAIILGLCCSLGDVQTPRNTNQLTVSELAAYLENLGKERRFDELKAFATSSHMYRFLATSAVVKYLPTDEAIAYCDQLKFGTGNWQGAFFTLVNHPKKKVIPYLARVYNKGDCGKVFCYEICRREKWPEFAEQARKDLSEYSSAVLFPNSPVETVAEYAQRYLSAITKGMDQEP
jgi:hypothetical protein